MFHLKDMVYIHKLARLRKCNSRVNFAWKLFGGVLIVILIIVQSGVNETDAVTDSVWLGFAPISVQNIYLHANIV